ncbi:MAG: serine/threonine-protein kinase [Planctomycetaceae bacterium]
MTQQSSVEIEPTRPTEHDVPLSDRPLVADEENTVISQGSESQPLLPETTLTATAQEIRDRLFSLPDAGDAPEQSVRIGQLQVESRIGSGGMGAVFRAVDLELSRTVALKILHPTIAADPALRARFRNEARACAALNHDNVARVFFSGEQDGVHYIVYEYADGQTIRQLIDEHGTLSPEETVNYAIQATLALIHINSAGIVHRDIKPSNIILTTAGRIKVVDLGLARRDTTDSTGDLTVAGTTLGTFDYIAPEQARDPHLADIRSDIYSLGCTVYHMLTGQPPYPEGTALQKLLDHQGKSPLDPRLLSRDIPEAVVAVLQRMMNADPDERYQDPAQLLHDLIEVASEMGLRSVPAEGIVWRRVPVTRVRELSGSLFLTGAVAAICVTALAMHFLPSGNSPEFAESIATNFFPRATTVAPTEPAATVTATIPGDPVDPSDTQSSGRPEESETGLTVTPASNGANSSVKPAPSDSETVMPEALSREPVVVYSPDGTEQRFMTLQMAWAGAANGDVIELDFDGPMDAPTYRLGPLQSQDSQQITLRAARGRSPVLVFTGDDRNNRAHSPGELFFLSDNLSLNLSGIDFQVRVREDVQSDQWVLFECGATNRIQMESCSISIDNPVHRNVAVFRLRSNTSESQTIRLSEIELNGVSVRGSCDLALIAGQLDSRISAVNCAFALNGSLVHTVGSTEMIPQGSVTVELRHCTSLLAGPAFLMADSDVLDRSEPERTLPTLDIHSTACIYSAAGPDVCLAESRGNAYPEVLQDLLSWTGQENLYHGYRNFWVINSGNMESSATPSDFDTWVSTWNRISIAEETLAEEMASDVWKRRRSTLAPDELTEISPESFELDRRFFYGTENMPPRHRLDANGQLPGVDISAAGFRPWSAAREPSIQPAPLTPAPPAESAASVNSSN